MDITSAQYGLDKEGNNICIVIIINEQEMSVPLDPANRHYQAIQEWVAEGNTIEEAD